MSRFAELRSALLLLFALCLVAPHDAQAAESYDNCAGFITSLPAVISTQGTWCLKSDLSTANSNGLAIDIQTNNVTIDCNGFKLGGLAAGVATNEDGIYSYNHQNITIRHCNVRGFWVGIWVYGSSGGGHLIEDNRLDSNTNRGIYIEGEGSIVRRNLIVNTGGSTSSNYSAMGISAFGTVDVIDNTISGVAPASGNNGAAYGIFTNGNAEGSISGNRIRSLVPSGPGSELGINNLNSGRLVLHGNELFGNAIANSNGMQCTSNSLAQAKDNFISGFTVGLSGCVNTSGNVIVP